MTVRSIPLVWTSPFNPTTEDVVVFLLELTSAIEMRGREGPDELCAASLGGEESSAESHPWDRDVVPNSGLKRTGRGTDPLR